MCVYASAITSIIISTISVSWQFRWEPLIESAVKPLCHTIDWSFYSIDSYETILTKNEYDFNTHSMAIQWNQIKILNIFNEKSILSFCHCWDRKKIIKPTELMIFYAEKSGRITCVPWSYVLYLIFYRRQHILQINLSLLLLVKKIDHWLLERFWKLRITNIIWMNEKLVRNTCLFCSIMND